MAIYKISFSFSWLAIQIVFWNLLTVETFNTKQSVEFLYNWEKSYNIFDPLKYSWNKIAIIASYIIDNAPTFASFIGQLEINRI